MNKLIILLAAVFTCSCLFAQNCGFGGPGSGGGGSGSTEWLAPGDPNEFLGPAGIGVKQWVAAKDSLNYTVMYENAAAIATAAAAVVKINYPIDPKQDINTFTLGTFGFNNSLFTIPPGTNAYYQRLNLIDSLGIYVDITAGIDVINREAFWYFQSVDTTTLILNLSEGFLPVSDSTVPNKGVGFVNFNIRPLNTTHTGDTMSPQAFIIFNTNDTVPTNTYLNTIDAVPPTSSIAPLSRTSVDPVTLNITAADDSGGVGFMYYNLYEAIDTGQFYLHQSQISSLTYTFTGSPGHTYKFYTIAFDSVLNGEGPKTVASAYTTIVGNTTVTPYFAVNNTPVSLLSDSVCQGSTYYRCIQAIDTAETSLLYTSAGNPAQGVLSLTANSSGVCAGYVPIAGYSGLDSFTISVCDTLANCDTLTVYMQVNATPLATISLRASAAICQSDSVMLDAGSGYTSYLWSDDETTETISVKQTGNYSCAVRQGSCQGNSDTINVTVNPSVTPSVSIAITSGSQTECSGSSVTFTATPVNGGSVPNYNFEVNGTSVQNGSSNTYTSTTSNNNDVVICIMTSNATCASPTSATSTGITMSVNPVVAPSISIAITTGSQTECSGSSVTFTATPTNGGSTPAYNFEVNGTSAQNGSSNTYTSTAANNNDVVTCIMTSNATCASPVTATSNSIPMTVTPSVNPSVSIAITSGSQTECSGSSVTFTATPTNGGSTPAYNFEVNGTSVQNSSSNIYASTALTNGEAVICIMTSSATCAGPATAISNSIQITVTSLLTPSVSIAITSGSQTECAGSSVTFTATPTNGGVAPTYNFKINGTSAQNGSSNTYTSTALANGKVITCIMTSSSSCASPTTATSNGITMTVTSALTPSVSIAITSGSKTECSGSSATFTATPTNGGSAPVYNFEGNGISIQNSSSNTYTSAALTNGEIVTCIMTSSATCASPTTATSKSITMAVNPTVTPSVNIAITSGSQTTCSGNSVTFKATPASGGGTPNYNFEVTGTSVQNSSAATFTSAALINGQTVTCIMASNAACASPTMATSNNITMTVETAPTAGPITGPSEVCTGEAGVVFSVTPVAGATSYGWTLPTGATGSSTTDSITVKFTTAFAGGNICVKAVNACTNGIASCASLAVYTIVPAAPVAILGGSNNACPGSTMSYSIASVANATSYTWTAPANATITAGQGTTNITLSFNSTFTTGTLKVKASDCAGSSANTSLSLYSTPAEPASITGLTTGVCGGNTLTYTCAAPNGATSYTWAVPAGCIINSGQDSTSVSVTLSSGFLTGAISVIAQSTCGSSSARSVTVKSVPATAEPGTITGTTTDLCNGNYAYSIAAVTNAGSYDWSLPAGCSIVGSGTGESIALDVSSYFTGGSLCVVALNSCGYSSASRCTTLSNVPPATSAITGSANVCENEAGLSYSVTNTTGIIYNWTLPAGCTITAGSGTSAITVTWGTAAGDISVEASNVCDGTSAAKTKAVTIKTSGCAKTTVAASKSEEVISDSSTVSGPDEILALFPNPTGNKAFLLFRSDAEIKYFVTIMDVTGRVTAHSEGVAITGENKITLDLSTYSDGIYFIQLANETKEIGVKKLVKSGE